MMLLFRSLWLRRADLPLGFLVLMAVGTYTAVISHEIWAIACVWLECLQQAITTGGANAVNAANVGAYASREAAWVAWNAAAPDTPSILSQLMLALVGWVTLATLVSYWLREPVMTLRLALRQRSHARLQRRQALASCSAQSSEPIVRC